MTLPGRSGEVLLRFSLPLSRLFVFSSFPLSTDATRIRKLTFDLFCSSVQRSELLLDFFRTVSPVLISRISEREESVRLEVFATLSLLLRQTLVFGKTASADEEEDYGRMTPGTLKRKREADEEEARKGGKRDAIMDDAEET